MSDCYGMFMFGCQYDLFVDFVQGIIVDNYLGSVFVMLGDVDNYDNSFCVDNVVKYMLVVYLGLQFLVMYLFGGIVGSIGVVQLYLVVVLYNNGLFSVVGGYFYVINSFVLGGLCIGWISLLDGMFDGLINNGYVSVYLIGIGCIVGQYVVGLFMFGVGYSNVQYCCDVSLVFGLNEYYNIG